MAVVSDATLTFIPAHKLNFPARPYNFKFHQHSRPIIIEGRGIYLYNLSQYTSPTHLEILLLPVAIEALLTFADILCSPNRHDLVLRNCIR